ncbi:unnamed protein product [Lathyrus sativus]|nr:unnamed protein product [Lathyrus sativus]
MNKNNNSSQFSFKGNSKNSSIIASAAKMVKPNSNNQTKLVDFVESIVQNPTLKSIGVAVQDSFNKESVILGKSSTPEEGVKKGHGKSKLYEICAANHWKPPVFECCKEEGPRHSRMFTFKVIIEIETGKASKNIERTEASKSIVEVYGAPHQKKKTAADDAAEGALWYLKHIGFVLKNK